MIRRDAAGHPFQGWLIVGLERAAGLVHVTMAHPDSNVTRHIRTVTEEDAVAMAILRRTGAVHWKPKRREAPCP